MSNFGFQKKKRQRDRNGQSITLSTPKFENLTTGLHFKVLTDPAKDQLIMKGNSSVFNSTKKRT